MHDRTNSKNVCLALLIRGLAVACITLSGCAGPTLLTQARALETSRPLTVAKDDRVLAAIDAIIVRNGAGAWAGDADWDEYLIRIRALSGEPIEIREVAIFDALDQRIEARPDRAALVDGTRETEKRYANAGQWVNTRRGNGWIAVGAGVMVTGGFIAASSGAPKGFLADGGSSRVGAGMVVVGGLALAAAGVARLIENAQVDRVIQRRRTTLPLAVAGGAETRVDLFFPITPQSARAQIVYADRQGEHRLEIDTRMALTAQYQEPPPMLVSRVDPEFPELARRQGIDQGHVIATLTIDRWGGVQGVDVTESVPPGVFTQAARRTFSLWTYNMSPTDVRTVGAKLEFKR